MIFNLKRTIENRKFNFSTIIYGIQNKRTNANLFVLIAETISKIKYSILHLIYAKFEKICIWRENCLFEDLQIRDLEQIFFKIIFYYLTDS